MVIETTVIVPCDDNHRILPGVAAHDGVYQIRHVAHAARRVSRWMLAVYERQEQSNSLAAGFLTSRRDKTGPVRRGETLAPGFAETAESPASGSTRNVYEDLASRHSTFQVTCEFCSSSAIVGNV